MFLFFTRMSVLCLELIKDPICPKLFCGCSGSEKALPEFSLSTTISPHPNCARPENLPSRFALPSIPIAKPEFLLQDTSATEIDRIAP